ncbi:hypothetical protein O181_071437 [Austropuccinia psidii MF-1]|uniref:Uncharacterized protein n=1 Tax=Austropuccinia psidii MF-1 TaxID=1389203 RepID=A0A9Q3F7Q2_9BASI|nr:hypothetical protein [Austropuccinia psidii MF-1]
MVMISPSLNVLSPSPSFIGRIITLLRLRSEVAIRWGVDKSILEGTGLIVRNCSCWPAWGPAVHLRLDMVSSLLTRASWARTLLAAWLEGADNKRKFLVCLSASITSVGGRQGTNAGDTPLGA